MAAPSRFSDDQLRQYLDLYKDDEKKVQKIAALFGVSSPAVSKRIAKLEQKSAPKAVAVVREAERDVFNVRQVLKDNYQRCIDLLGEEGISHSDRIRAIAEIRQHGQAAMAILETLYSIEEVHEFQKAVLAVLGEVDESTRKRVLDRLRQRRAIRAAFVPSGD